MLQGHVDGEAQMHGLGEGEARLQWQGRGDTQLQGPWRGGAQVHGIGEGEAQVHELEDGEAQLHGLGEGEARKADDRKAELDAALPCHRVGISNVSQSTREKCGEGRQWAHWRAARAVEHWVKVLYSMDTHKI